MLSHYPVIAMNLVCMLVLLANPVHAQEGATPPPVSLPGTEVRSILSSHTGEQYDIYIQPVGSAASDERYPVVYILDAQWDFPMVTGIYGGLNYDEFMPNVILVGITYNGESPDYGTLRAMDMTPTSVEHVPGSGRAPRFLAFIKEELIPFIESKYNADPAGRTLMGSSYGGLFTLYALFHEPDLFDRYVAPSSALHWDNGIIFQYEEALAQERSDLPIRLFLTAGEYEGEGMIKPMKTLEQTMTSRNYPSLRMKTDVVKSIRHASIKPESFTRGLSFVFAPDTVSLAPELLESIVGEYKLDIPPPEEITLAITKEGSQLFIESQWDWGKIELFAESDTSFFFKEFNGRITAERNESDEIRKLKINLGDILTAYRID